MLFPSLPPGRYRQTTERPPAVSLGIMPTKFAAASACQPVESRLRLLTHR
jgi:hypothetical protein